MGNVLKNVSPSKIPLEDFVWIYDTFDNNLVIKNDLLKIWRRVVDNVLNNVSSSNDIPTKSD